MKPVLGFVGLGRIGRPLVERLLGAGFELVVFDVDPAAMRVFEGRATIARSGADVADRSDAVFGCLQTTGQYLEAILGAAGVIHGERARIYIHIGTTGSECVRALISALGSRAAGAIDTLDAPMSGGVAGAAAGTLVSMVAGPRHVYDAMRPCLDAYSKRIVFLGAEPGTAQTMKLVNNMLSAANLVTATEVMLTGLKAGLPFDAMLDVINHGTGQNSATLTKIPNNIASRKFDVGSTLANGLKDLGLYLDEADRLGVDSTLSRAVLERFHDAVRQGAARDDFGTVVRPLERAAGIELARGATVIGASKRSA